MVDGLEQKFKLMQMLAFDKRLKRRHCAVYGFILDWYHRKYGDALASVRHIDEQLKARDPSGVGFYLGDIHSALTDLVEWNYLSREDGSGRRANRYTPVWDKFSSVREIPNATNEGLVFGETPNANVREIPNANCASVREIPNQDPFTSGPGDKTRVREEMNHLNDAPLSPGSDGRAVAAGADGFEQLWRAYFPKKGLGDKSKARKAYEALNPDDGQLAELVQAAVEWHKAWESQGKTDAPRKHLDTWLRGEHFECEPPTAYVKKASRKASNDNAPRKLMSLRKGIHRGEFIKAELVECGQNCVVELVFARADDQRFKHTITLKSADEKKHASGNEEFTNLVRALRLSDVDDTEDLLSIPLQIDFDGEEMTYLPIDEAV